MAAIASIVLGKLGHFRVVVKVAGGGWGRAVNVQLCIGVQIKNQIRIHVAGYAGICLLSLMVKGHRKSPI